PAFGSAGATSSCKTRTPPEAIAPTASSSNPGTPSLRTMKTSSGTRNARATSYATGTPPRGRPSTITSSRPAYLESFSPSNRPASARFGKPPSMRSRFAPNNFAERSHFGDRPARFDIIAKAVRESRPPQLPPRFHSRQMKVHSRVGVPSFPLLRVQRPLAFLKPSLLEKFEWGELD